jgi:ribosomal protein S12 methylthiotransferase
MPKKFGLISLGCPKNLVDSETFSYVAIRHGYEQSDDFADLDFILVNTCSFIQDAVNELNKVLKEICGYKARHKVKKIFVTGCIMKRFLRQMQEKFPVVDAWIDIRDFSAFEDQIAGKHLKTYQRYPLTEGPYSYLKISDGCNNNCTYCTIPSIRGKLKSSKMEDLVREATYLANTGARELVIIAQDTTAYGNDIYEKQMLPELLTRVHDIPDFYWIRLMYLHPRHVTDELINTIAALPKVVHAFEMPLQHCNDTLLKSMNRHYKKADIVSVYERFISAMPDAQFRTTFITGFPGETHREFNELLDFVSKYRFLRMGAFAYSPEAGTPAAVLAGRVSARTAQKRKNELLALHRELAEQYLSDFIGKELEVIVEDAYPEQNEYIGRAWFDAPEIDGIVNFTGKGIGYGDIVQVKIEDVIDIDLFGRHKKTELKYDFQKSEE